MRNQPVLRSLSLLAALVVFVVAPASAWAGKGIVKGIGAGGDGTGNGTLITLEDDSKEGVEAAKTLTFVSPASLKVGVGDLVSFRLDRATGEAVVDDVLQAAVDAAPDADGVVRVRSGDLVLIGAMTRTRKVSLAGGIAVLTAGASLPDGVEASLAAAGGDVTITPINLDAREGFAILAETSAGGFWHANHAEPGMIAADGWHLLDLADCVVAGNVAVQGGERLSMSGTSVGGRVRATQYRRVQLEETSFEARLEVDGCDDLSAVRIIAGKGIGDDRRGGPRGVSPGSAWRTHRVGRHVLADSAIEGNVASVSDGAVIITGNTIRGNLVVINAASCACGDNAVSGRTIVRTAR